VSVSHNSFSGKLKTAPSYSLLIRYFHVAPPLVCGGEDIAFDVGRTGTGRKSYRRCGGLRASKVTAGALGCRAVFELECAIAHTGSGRKFRVCLTVWGDRAGTVFAVTCASEPYIATTGIHGNSYGLA